MHLRELEFMNNVSKNKSKKSEKLSSINITNIRFNDGFWNQRIQQVQNEVIPYQWKALNDQIPDVEKSHAIENFHIAAGIVNSKFYGKVFQDSDVAKWLEAVSYSLEYKKNPELENIIDEVIDLIVKAQQSDGYLNTYFTVAKPGKRWTNVRDCHELYCAGHMIEAAVAYYQATGKRKLLDVICKLADHIDSIFGPEEGKKKGYPGHPEIELALVKLFKVTKNEKYLKLSKFFIDERGQQPHFFDIEAAERGESEKKPYFFNLFDYSYNQSHVPVREQSIAVGHAVRAMYLYCGMTDIAIETSDEELKDKCKRLWENVTKGQMYVTGGIGSSAYNEAFTFDYDLPNDTAYTETCAAIGLVFWAHRMLHLEINAKYADIMERALYNGVLSGISLDGKKYFYVNPLEVWPESCDKRYDKKHIETTRQQWFGCACCPPNIARLIASVGKYVYSKGDNEVYLHLYTDSIAEFNLLDQKVTITQNSNYPWDEEVNISIYCEKPIEFTFGIRIPGWCQNAVLSINGKVMDLDTMLEQGYVKIDRVWNDDRVKLFLPMPVERIHANPKLRNNSGKIAIQRGPVIYCLEEVDNGTNLPDIVLPARSELNAKYDEKLLGGVVTITGDALKTDMTLWKEDLYKPVEYNAKKIRIKAVPYYTWNNRKPGEMLVWIREGC